MLAGDWSAFRRGRRPDQAAQGGEESLPPASVRSEVFSTAEPRQTQRKGPEENPRAHRVSAVQ